jgi:hypothetical protein
VRLEEFLEKNHGLFEQDYIPLYIDIAKMSHGTEVADRLGKPANAGIPWIVILDAAGEKLITSDGPNGNIGYPFEPHEIEFFLAMLKSTAKHMGDEQLAEVEAILKENAERTRSLRRQGNG